MQASIIPECVNDFLAPLEGDLPFGCGLSLRYCPVFDEIQEAQRADENLPRGIWEFDLKKANWPRVAELCKDTLKTQSKDLHIAAWLTEAWFFLEGVMGFRKGVVLLRELCEKFWPHIHPEIEAGDYDFRMAPFEWLQDQFGKNFSLLSITSPADENLEPLSWEKISQTALTPEKSRTGQSLTVENSISQTPPVFFENLYNEFRAALAEITLLEVTLKEFAPAYAFSFHRLKPLLQALQDFAKQHTPIRVIEIVPTSVSQSAISERHPIAPEEYSPLPPIQSRGQAYAYLRCAAEYLLRTEPHSPTPYLVKKTLPWEKLPLGDVFAEMTAEGWEISQIVKFLGLKSL